MIFCFSKNLTMWYLARIRHMASNRLVARSRTLLLAPFAKLPLLFNARLLDDFLLRAMTWCTAQARLTHAEVGLPLIASAPLPLQRALRRAGFPGSQSGAQCGARSRSHAVSWNTRLIRRSKPRIRFLRATPPPPAPADFAAWDVAFAGFAEWTTWLDGATLATGFSRVSSLRAFCFHEPAVFVRGFCQVPPLLLVWGMN